MSLIIQETISPDAQDSADKQNLLTKEEEGLTFDESLMKAGGFGLFQVYAFIFLLFGMLSNGYIFYALPYLELFPDYICPADKPNCDHRDHCADKSIQVNWDSTRSLDNWVETLNLDCVQPYQIGLLGSLYFAGWMAASLIIPRAGDIYGRKWPFLISLLYSFPVYLGLILSRNINLSIALFFLLGTSNCGKYQISYVYISELIPVKYRTYTGSLTQFFDSFTIMLIALYFRFMSKHWLYFEIFGITVHGLALIACLIIPESPKFLYSKGKFDEAKKGLRTIARFNRTKLEDFKFIDEIPHKDHDHKDETHHYKSDVIVSMKHSELIKTLERSKVAGIRDASFMDQDLLKQDHSGNPGDHKLDGTLRQMIKNKVLLFNLLIFIVLWIVSSFSYFMILFQLKYLQGDIFVNTIVAAGAEMGAYAFVSITLDRIGIKRMYCGAYTIGAIGSILYVIFGADHQNLVAVFVLGAAFGVSSSCIVNWVATVQLFPVIYASTTVGVCNFFCRLLNILAPQFAEIAQPLPMIVVASACCVAAVLVLFLNTNIEKLNKH